MHSNEIINSCFNDVGRDFDYRKREIPFDLFKSFFHTATFELSYDNYMGWKDWESNCKTLSVHTATFGGGTFIDSVKHKTKANNKYNNYVNAFAYWDMLNQTGRDFFLKFYQMEIVKIKSEKWGKIEQFKRGIKQQQSELESIESELLTLQLPPK